MRQNIQVIYFVAGSGWDYPDYEFAKNLIIFVESEFQFMLDVIFALLFLFCFALNLGSSLSSNS